MILQSDPAWAQARLGHVTASRIHDVVATTRTGGYGASRANYEAELIAERLTGQPADRPLSEAMRWGLDTEPQARAAYEFYMDRALGDAAFIVHPRIEWSGASPDGFVDRVGLVEFKCPNTATHIDTLLSRKVPEKYVLQMQWQMAVTEREWCDFASFDPRMPEEMRLFVLRVGRDDKRITELEREVAVFLDGVQRKIELLTRQHNITAAEQK